VCSREKKVAGCCGEGGDGCGRRNQEQRLEGGLRLEDLWMGVVVRVFFSKGGSDGLEKMRGKGGGLKEMGLGLGFFFCFFF